MSQHRKIQLFLCHSSRDKLIVKDIAQKLQSESVNVWYDDWNIEYGDSITSKINEGISESDYIAVVLSPSAVSSKWVEKEWSAAFHSEQKWGSIKVLPLLLEDCDIPPLLADRKYVDLRDNSRVGNLAKLRDWLEYKSRAYKIRSPVAEEYYKFKQRKVLKIKEGEQFYQKRASVNDKSLFPVTSSAHLVLKGRWGSNEGAGEIVDNIAGRVAAVLIKVYPLAMIEETEYGMRFPFGEIIGKVKRGKAIIDLNVIQESELDFPTFVSSLNEPIEYVEYEFLIFLNVAEIIDRLQSKKIEIKYFRSNAIKFETKKSEIRIESKIESLKIRLSRKDYPYSISPHKLPSPGMLLELVMGIQPVTMFDNHIFDGTPPGNVQPDSAQKNGNSLFDKHTVGASSKPKARVSDKQAASKISQAIPIPKDKKNKKKKILFLAANQPGDGRLSIDREFRAIDVAVGNSRNRLRLELIPKFAVRYEDFRQALLDHEPQIVHFSGHGTEDGLVVLDEGGIFPEMMSTEVVSRLFELFSKRIECVILSACYSERQAAAIVKHIPYVIGMDKEIEDNAAIEFSKGFYDALGAGRSIEDAFQLGVQGILQAFPELPQQLIPVLKKRQ
jgi:hypothetical protein